MLYYRKKESNKKHYIKLTILIALIVFSSLVPKSTTLSSNVLLTVVRPINNLASTISNGLRGFVDNLVGTKPNREMVNKLTEENTSLKEDINKLQTIVNNQEILREEYELMKNDKLIKARVIALDGSNTFNNFIINRGADAKLKKNDIVVAAFTDKNMTSPKALVGKIDEVYKNTSRVVSIKDDKFNLTFMHKNTSDLGVINARSGGLFEGYMLDKSTNITKKDLVLTSGIGGIYEKGILIGEVEEVRESDDELSKLVKIKSPINFMKIYNVFIIRNKIGD